MASSSSMHRRSSTETTIRYSTQSSSMGTMSSINRFSRKSINGLLNLFRKSESTDCMVDEEPFYPLHRSPGSIYSSAKSNKSVGSIRSMIRNLGIRRDLHKSPSRWSLRSKGKRDSTDEPRVSRDMQDVFRNPTPLLSPVRRQTQAVPIQRYVDTHFRRSWIQC